MDSQHDDDDYVEVKYPLFPLGCVLAVGISALFWIVIIIFIREALS